MKATEKEKANAETWATSVPLASIENATAAIVNVTKKVRKPLAPPTKVIPDKTKYSRKVKHESA